MRELLAPGTSNSDIEPSDSSLPDEYTVLERICAYFDQPNGPKTLLLYDYGAAISELSIAPCNSYWGSLEEIELCKRVFECSWTHALAIFSDAVAAEPRLARAANKVTATIKRDYLGRIAQNAATLSEQLAEAYEFEDEGQKRLIGRWRDSAQRAVQGAQQARETCELSTKRAFLGRLARGPALSARCEAASRQNLTALVAQRAAKMTHSVAAMDAQARKSHQEFGLLPVVLRMRLELHKKRQALTLKRRILKHMQSYAAALSNADTRLQTVSRPGSREGALGPPAAVAAHALDKMSVLTVSAEMWTLRRKKQLLRHWLGTLRLELVTSVWAVRAVRRILASWRMHAAALLLHNLSTLRNAKGLLQLMRASATQLATAEQAGAEILGPQLAGTFKGLAGASRRTQAMRTQSEALRRSNCAAHVLSSLDAAALDARAAQTRRANLGRLAVQHLREKRDAVLASRAASFEASQRQNARANWLVAAVERARVLADRSAQASRSSLKPLAAQTTALAERISECSALSATAGAALAHRTLGQTTVAALEQVLELEGYTELVASSYSAQISAELMRSAVVVAQRLRLRWAEAKANRARSDRQLWRRALGAWYARAVPRDPGTPRSAKIPPSVLRRMQSAGAAGTPTARPGSPSTPRRLLFRPSSSPAPSAQSSAQYL